MPDEEGSPTGKVIGSASGTLSQLLARILNQLALSAWLPSAALTLLVAFVIQLAAVLNGTPAPSGPLDAVHHAFEGFGRIGISGLVLIVTVIVVLTMITQAFAFESIRVLEGYWGTFPPVERVASWRCSHYRKVRKHLVKKHRKLTSKAWKVAETKLVLAQAKLEQKNEPRELTPEMITALGDQVLDRETKVTLTPEQEEQVDGIDWTQFGPAEIIRRRANLGRRMADFPVSHSVLPTRLGNILKHFEDMTGSNSIESLVNEVFDSLPFSLQVDHDEQRGRLDLYCSTVFMLGFASVIAAITFGRRHWDYAATSLVLGFVLAIFIYRASIASARAYGALLVVIARYSEQSPAEAPQKPNGLLRRLLNAGRAALAESGVSGSSEA